MKIRRRHLFPVLLILLAVGSVLALAGPWLALVGGDWIEERQDNHRLAPLRALPAVVSADVDHPGFGPSIGGVRVDLRPDAGSDQMAEVLATTRRDFPGISLRVTMGSASQDLAADEQSLPRLQQQQALAGMPGGSSVSLDPLGLTVTTPRNGSVVADLAWALDRAQAAHWRCPKLGSVSGVRELEAGSSPDQDVRVACPAGDDPQPAVKGLLGALPAHGRGGYQLEGTSGRDWQVRGTVKVTAAQLPDLRRAMAANPRLHLKPVMAS